MTKTYCKHVYQEVKENPCEFCGKETHSTNWEFQHQLHREWISSGKASLQGWWSI